MIIISASGADTDALARLELRNRINLNQFEPPRRRPCLRRTGTVAEAAASGGRRVPCPARARQRRQALKTQVPSEHDEPAAAAAAVVWPEIASESPAR